MYGMLAKEASFRLIVTGNIGVKEIERLIQKLEIDKEILADLDDGPGSRQQCRHRTPTEAASLN